MDLQKLIYLASVIESGSLKKASKELRISQPALSTSMGRLESSLGGRLLDRSPAGVSPTPLGEILYFHARLIRDELKLAERRVRAGQRRDESVITIGALPSLMASIMPKAVCDWREEHPCLTLRLIERIQLELVLSLVRGELDFIIAQTECYGFEEGLKQRVLFRDRLHVIGRPGHPAFDLEQLTWSRLAQFPWVVQMVGRQRFLLEKLLASEGADMPASLTECGSVSCLKAIVAGSDSLAMLPASALGSDVDHGRLRPLDMTDERLNRDIAVIFRDSFPIVPAGRDLVDKVAAAGLRL